MGDTTSNMDHQYIEQHLHVMLAHMRRKMRANMHKPGWRGDTVESLIKRLREEVDELEEHIQSGSNDIYGEAADVANFAMMVADVASVDRFARRIGEVKWNGLYEGPETNPEGYD